MVTIHSIMAEKMISFVLHFMIKYIKLLGCQQKLLGSKSIILTKYQENDALRKHDSFVCH